MQILKVDNNKISSGYFTQPKIKTPMKNEGVLLSTINNYSNISFNAKIKISNKQIHNIENEKNRILKLLDDILGTTVKKTNIKDAAFKAKLYSINSLKTEPEKVSALFDMMEELEDDSTLSWDTKYRRMTLMKKFAIRMKNRTSLANPQSIGLTPKSQDERFDYKLANKLKNAITEDEFNLEKIYHKHYQDLETISNLNELQKKYPSIGIPTNPKDVISDKIIKFLTRSFYLEYDKYFSDNIENNKAIFFEKISSIIESIAKKYKVSSEELRTKISDNLFEKFSYKYEQSKLKGFSQVSEYRKNAIPKVNEIDIKMLNIDFENFILSTVKKHYLESQKINQIEYIDPISDSTIKLSSLSNTEYKITKFPDKLRHVINAGNTILNAKRSYSFFDMQYLKNRLDFYSESEVGNNIEILEKIIDFDGSDEPDKKYLIRFIEELDKIFDEKQTPETAIKKLKEEDIRPKNKHKISEIEYQKAIEKKQKEQEIVFKLDSLKKDFDNAINLLYTNNLTEIASICSKYRPKQYSPSQIGRAEFIIEQINKKLNDNIEPDTTRLESTIKYWDTYQNSIKEDLENPILKKAKKFASTGDNVDIIKAGQYLTFSEIVNYYPDSIKLVEYPELLTKIIEKTEGDKEAAIKYLCKYNDYEMLESSKKSFISEFISIFDMKDNIDKQIIKHIIENDYIYSDSTTTISLNDATTANQDVTISSKAKQEIYEKYKFPNCIDLFENFEFALSNLARAKGESGIKQIGRNKKTAEYKIEIKLNKYPDRLFSSKNDFYFDVYSERGLH